MQKKRTVANVIIFLSENVGYENDSDVNFDKVYAKFIVVKNVLMNFKYKKKKKN